MIKNIIIAVLAILSLFLMLSYNGLNNVTSESTKETSVIQPCEKSIETNVVASEIKTQNLDEFAITYEMEKINSNRGVVLHDLKIGFSKQLSNGWYGYIFDIDITAQGKRFTTKDILFTNGYYSTSSLTSNSGVDLKRMMHPTLDNRFTDEKYRIAGSRDAKNSLVIFSEPLCPACVNVLPAYINEVNNSNDLALYYIPMPLDMHPTARLLVRASKKAKSDGVEDVDMKLYVAASSIYKTNPRIPFDPYQETSEEKALLFFNQAMGTNYTIEDVSTEDLVKYVEDSLNLANDSMANGTPTIFFNNEIDPNRNGHKHLIKR